MKTLKETLLWLETESQNMRFGTIGFQAIVHNGKIVRIERSVTHKLQNDDKTVEK